MPSLARLLRMSIQDIMLYGVNRMSSFRDFRLGKIYFWQRIYNINTLTGKVDDSK